MSKRYMWTCGTVIKRASLWESRSSGFPTRSDTNRAVQPQKIVRGLKFRIKEVGGFFYLSSENKGADQLRSYCAADLRLYFRILKKKTVFSWRGSNMSYTTLKFYYKQEVCHTGSITQASMDVALGCLFLRNKLHVL